MNIKNKTVLITGANRGIGQALVNEALERGAKRVYAGARTPVSNSDKRVTPLALDVTNALEIQRAAAKVDTLDVLINNAGVSSYDDLSNLDVIEQHQAPVADGWRTGVVKALERQFSALIQKSAADLV